MTQDQKNIWQLLRTPSFLLLIVLGIIGNYWTYNLFYSADIVFGSIATLVAVVAFGTGPGLLVAVLSSIMTYFLWNHPYMGIIFILEAAFVGLFWRKFWSSVILAAGFFWIIFGLPLIWLSYKQFLKLDDITTAFAALKQSANGIFNALIATTLITQTPLLSLLTGKRSRGPSLFQTILCLLAFAAMIPALIIVVGDSRKIAEKVEEDTRLHLMTISQAIAESVEKWHYQHYDPSDLINSNKAATYLATIVDKDDHVIDSNIPDVRPGDDFKKRYINFMDRDQGSFFHRWPFDDTPLRVFKWKKGYFGEMTDLKGSEGWHLYVELPLAPEQKFLFQQYIRSLSILLTLFSAILLCSLWVASRVSKPLEKLSNETTNLPERLASHKSIVWPKSPFIEFTAIVENFDSMIEALKRKFQDQQQVTDALRISENKSRELAESQAFLAQAGKILNSTLDLEKVLNSLAHLAVPAFADWCVVNVLNADQSLSQQGMAHRDPEKIQWLKKIFRHPSFRSTPHGIEKVLKTGQSDLMANVTPEFLLATANSVEYYHLLDNAGIKSYICVPLRARGMIFGTISFSIADSAHKYSEDDLRFAEDLASRAAIAVDNARLYGEAQAINRVKDEFLATLSHELRTPLNIILGHAEILKMDAPNLGSELNSSIDAIMRNAKTQNQIIADLLDISAIITGKISFNPQMVSPSDITHAAVEGVRFGAESKGLQLHLQSLSPDVKILGDSTRIQQIIWNLLSNAVKFTPKGGRVEVTTKTENSKFVIEVKDTGPGIEPSFLPYVFDRFRQEDNSMTRRFGGLGLGLSIVRQLVELHGGSIRAESEGKGQGTVFTVYFPIAAAFSDPLAQNLVRESSAKTAQHEGLEGSKILVLDDELDARELVGKILTRAGAQVILSSSAEEALALCKSERPDLIVSDIGMPSEDGFSFLRKWRLHESDTGIFTPAIALTAYAREEDRKKVLAAGYQAHLAKPVSSQELTRVSRELLQQFQT